ncbi:MAG: hypothetical protein LBB23_02160 [Rickettsiales bacterium]|jgi:cation:H+ antiporter|nr:hypothetical protein [Rickettsiales bacterium]
MHWVYLILSLSAMMIGANWLVRGCIAIAHRLRVSEFIISVVIIGIGTSLPELLISIISGVRHMGELVITTNIVANIFNVFFVLGLGALIHPIIMDGRKHLTDLIFICVVSIVAAIMLFFPPIGKAEAAILLALFAAYMILKYKMQNNKSSPELSGQSWKITASFALVIAGIAATYFSSIYFMNALEIVSDMNELNETLAGILIVAPGTSTPELLITLTAAIHRRPQIAIGNIIGSNLMHIMLIISAGALVADLGVNEHIQSLDIWVMLLSVAALMFSLLYNRKISRMGGVIYLGIFALYIAAALAI